MTTEQYNKLDKCYFNYSICDNCIEETVEARTLLGPNRFDLYGILFYIDQKVKGVSDLSFAKEVYKERTRAMTGFRLSEIGNNDKNTIDDFFSVLDKLISDFKNDKFDIDKTLIPVDRKGEPIDGAHRVSCAAYFGKKIKVLHFLEREVSPYNYTYLRNNYLPEDIAEIMALEAIKWHNDIYALFFWPRAHKRLQELHKSIQLIEEKCEVYFEVDYKLSFEAIKNLMIQLYGHMDWVGNIDDGYSNITSKVDEVWAENGILKIMLVRANCCKDVLSLKSEIRDIFGIGLASIHSTDNIRETSMAMNALLNSNSRHMLLNANVTRYKEPYKLFSRFRHLLEYGNFDKNEFILDSSMVLSIYGLRPARDLDYYCLHNCIKQYPKDFDIEEHDDSQKQYYSLPVRDLILNPKNYFVYNEIKFVSIDNLLHFKQNRYNTTREIKDFQDIELIKSILSDKTVFRKTIIRWKLYFKRKKRIIQGKIYEEIVRITKKLNVYDSFRKIKHRVFRSH